MELNSIENPAGNQEKRQKGDQKAAFLF